MILRTTVLLLFYCGIILAIAPIVVFCAATGIRDPLIRIGRWAMGISRFVLGIRIDVPVPDSLNPDRPAVYMANHASFLDGPLLFLVIRRPLRIILKTQVFRIPVLGLAMRHAGFVPVDRKGARGGQAAIERAGRLMRDRRYSFLIFPEGTRSRTGDLQPFRRGGFFLAKAADAPIVPVSILGTYGLMPKGAFIPKRGTIRVAFHPPVFPGEGRIDIPAPGMDSVRARIAAGLDASRRIHGPSPNRR